MALSAVAIVGASRRHADRRAGLADGGHAGADRQLAGDEVGAAGRAARLGVVVGEQHALGGELVEVRRPPGHHAAVVGADVPDADVVAHDDDDIGSLRRCLSVRRGADQRGGDQQGPDSERTAGARQARSSGHVGSPEPEVATAFMVYSCPGIRVEIRCGDLRRTGNSCLRHGKNEHCIGCAMQIRQTGRIALIA